MLTQYKEKMFKDIFLSTQEHTKYGFPLKIIRRLIWPFVCSSQFYILNQLILLIERIENIENKLQNTDGISCLPNEQVEKMAIINTEIIALKRNFLELINKG